MKRVTVVIERPALGTLYLGSPLAGGIVTSLHEGDYSDLLEALEMLLSDTQHKNHNCGDESWCPVIFARAAIARARGEA